MQISRLLTYTFFSIFVFVVSCCTPQKKEEYIPDSIHQQQINSFLKYAQNIDIQNDPTKFVQFLDSSTLFLEQTQGSYEIRKSLIYYLAEQLENLGLVDESIKVLTKALKDNTVTFPDDSIYNNRSLYGSLSRLHKLSESHDSAFFYEKLSIKEVQLHRNPFEVAAPINEIGIHHLDLGHLDSASFYFQQCIDTLTKYPPNTQYWDFFRCSVNDNIATTFEIQNQYKKSLPLYRYNFNWYWRLRHLSKKHNAGISLANAFAEIQEFDSSKVILDSVKLELDTATYNGKYENTLYLNQTLSNYYRKIQNISKSNEYAAIAAQLENKTLLVEKATAFMYNKKIKAYANERNRQKIEITNARSREEIKKRNLQLLAITFILIIVAMAFWGYYFRNKSNKKKLELETQLAKQQALQEKNSKKLLDIELENKKKDLLGISLNLKHQNTWVEEVNKQLGFVKSSVGRQRKNELDKLQKQVQYHLHAFKDCQIISNNLDELDNSFFSQLQIKFPSLTKSEQQLFSLIKINLNTVQIAQIKNIEHNSVKTLRHRLKRKLNLSPDTDLDSFIHRF